MKITATVIRQLVPKHIGRYKSRFLEAQNGNSLFRADELKFYLSLWQSIQRKKCNPNGLSREEKAEILDALDDESDASWEW